MTTDVHVTAEDGVLRIQLNRPEKKNAITRAMYGALNAALDQANQDDSVRCVLLEGSGGVFTAGNDLMDFMAEPPKDLENAPVFKFLRHLVHLSKPLIASVDGLAIGVGSTMLLHCDLVYCSERAKFSFPFVDLGLVPEAASSVALASRVGQIRAHEWLLFGEPITAAVAESAGLVTKVVPAEELTAFARSRAATLAKKPKEALRMTKDLLRVGDKARTLEAMDREGAHFLERLTSEEAKTAFMAFFARKK